MFDAYVQKFDVTDTVENFLELNRALGIGAKTPKFSFYFYCIWISKFTLAVADSSKEFSTNFFILCLPANLAAYPAPPRARRLISLAQHSRPPRNATSSNSGARSSSSAVGWSHIHGACVAVPTCLGFRSDGRRQWIRRRNHEEAAEQRGEEA